MGVRICHCKGRVVICKSFVHCTHNGHIAEGHLVVAASDVAEIGYNCRVLAFEVTPVLTTVLPDLLVRVGRSLMCVTYSHVVTVVIYFHKWAAFALFITQIVSFVSDVDLVVLEELIHVCVLVRRQSIVEVLDQHDAVLEPRRLEIERDYQFVAGGLEFGVCSLVARSVGSRLSCCSTTRGLQRKQVVAT